MASILSDYLPKINQRITDYHIILVFFIMLRATVNFFDTIKEIIVNVCEMQSRENRVYLSVVVKLCLNIFSDHVSQFLIV